MVNKIENRDAEKILQLLKDENQLFKAEFKEPNSLGFWFESSKVNSEWKDIKPFGVTINVQLYNFIDGLKGKTINYYFNNWYYSLKPDFHLNLCLESHKPITELDIDEFLEDDKYYFVVKNFNKLSGSGSLVRLTAGIKHHDKKILRELKLDRIRILNNKLGLGVITYEKGERLAICKLLKSDLESNKTKFLSDFWNQFLRFCFLVEIIREE